MADAIPVNSEPQEPPKAPKPAPQKPVKEIDHDAYVGKDHPEFGTWVGAGWRKDN